jgi:hypothetical protein
MNVAELRRHHAVNDKEFLSNFNDARVFNEPILPEHYRACGNDTYVYEFRNHCVKFFARRPTSITDVNRYQQITYVAAQHLASGDLVQPKTKPWLHWRRREVEVRIIPIDAVSRVNMTPYSISEYVQGDLIFDSMAYWKDEPPLSRSLARYLFVEPNVIGDIESTMNKVLQRGQLYLQHPNIMYTRENNSFRIAITDIATQLEVALKRKTPPDLRRD